ncbi:MAG: NAD-dependent malic enzyme [Legionellaceae bacterium]|nr:NAD-dependent malic enzyme [Legionellaceae bacterium]
MSMMISQRGQVLLRDPLLNKGTAFTQHERNQLELNGLLPPHIESMDEQLQRAYEAFSTKTPALEKHIYLRALQDRNETLFYRLVLEHLEELLPIIYTPVVGEACEQFHHIYRQPRGLFISYPQRAHMDTILAAVAATRDIRVIVVTDGERILGLGDQGVGGMGIPIGKLSLYTACGGINPAHTLPVILDVGTNNPERIDDPEYLGWRHARINGEDYDTFVDQFVQGVKTHFPHAMLQFEDFAQAHAYPLLERYQDELCTFNDDIQGTASVTAAAIVAASKVANTPLKDMNIAVLGAGSAGCGISEQLVRVMVAQGLDEAQARKQFYLVDRQGLLHDAMADTQPFQQGLLQSASALETLGMRTEQSISLAEVIQKAKPEILLGVSGQPQQFSEGMVKMMSRYCERPIIFPLSNPTSRCEAQPADLLRWSDGKALIATGSPFASVPFNGQHIPISQCNNAYIFPGIGLAVVASHAKRVTNKMMMAAAMALSELAPAVQTGTGALLPELHSMRTVSQHIAKAVIREAIAEGHVNAMDAQEIDQLITETMWFPQYRTD